MKTFMTGNIICRRVFAVMLTLVLLIAALFGMSEVVKRKSSYTQYADFFDEKQDFDVLFFGTSHIMDAVYPMELWKDYGFISYNCGGHANAVATTYWAAQMALEHTTPSLIVIDCLGLTEEAKTSRNSFSYVHLSMDAFPFNRTKVRAVYDLLDDREVERLIAEDELIIEEGAWIGQEEDRDPISLLWPFSIYHNRWSSLGRSDFRPPRNIQKGAETMIGVRKPVETVQVPADEKLEKDTVSIEYLEKLITDCQARGINILLTYLPFPASEEEQLEAHRLYDIALQYDVGYLNFLDLDVVDFQTDCFDGNSHLNRSGAGKVTAYLGDYLTSHYELPDHRNDPAYASWHEDYEEYRVFQHLLLQGQDQLSKYLMLLANKNYSFDLSLGDDRIFTLPSYRHLLQNIGVEMDYPIVTLPEADFEIRVYDRDTEEEFDAIQGTFVLNTAGELTDVIICHL